MSITETPRPDLAPADHLQGDGGGASPRRWSATPRCSTSVRTSVPTAGSSARRPGCSSASARSGSSTPRSRRPRSSASASAPPWRACARRRADVRRLHGRLPGPDLQPHGEDPLRVRRQRAGADGADHGGRRRLLRRGPALPVPVGHVRPPARHEGRRAEHPGRREGPDDRGDPRRQPGRLHVPQGRDGPAVDGEEPAQHGRGSRGRARRADRQGAGRARRAGRQRGDPVAVGAPRARRGRQARRRGHRRRGRRPAQPGPAGPGGDPRVGGQDRPAGRGRRGLPVVRCLRRGRRRRSPTNDPGLLRAPVRRVAMPDVPIPYAHGLEYAVLPRPGPDRGARSGRPC